MTVWADAPEVILDQVVYVYVAAEGEMTSTTPCVFWKAVVKVVVVGCAVELVQLVNEVQPDDTAPTM